MLVNILYLTQRRKHFSNLIFYILKRCNFKDFNITVCGVENIDADEARDVCNVAKEMGLNATTLITKYGHTNYMDKIREAVNLLYKYTIKMDEDIFMGPRAWDYFFNSLQFLDNEDNILIAPTLSTGIPTCDTFIEYNFTPEEKQEIFEIFSKTQIPDLWDASYQVLRDEIATNGYTTAGYFAAVKNIPHYYKGIHPIRINIDAIKYINSKIENKIDLFLENREFFIEELTRPYLCNSFFGIKTDHWKRIIDDRSLSRDNFDEVTINNYRDLTNKKFLTIPNSFAIHTLYNTLHCEMNLPLKEMNELENSFIEIVRDKVKSLI